MPSLPWDAVSLREGSAVTAVGCREATYSTNTVKGTSQSTSQRETETAKATRHLGSL